MELIYLYVGNIGRTVSNYGIGFSRQFNVDYNSESGQLNITRNSSNSYSSIYGDNILDIDLIVGKNGSGKTTALSLLGLSRSERLWEYPPEIPSHSDENSKRVWFALYFIKDNYFAVEGYWCETLEFMRHIPYAHFQVPYSICIKYDFARQTGEFVQYLQELRYDNKINYHRELFYLFYENSVELDWVKPIIRINSYDNGSSSTFERAICERNGCRGIIKFLYDACNSSEFMSFLGTKPGTVITISVSDVKSITKSDLNEISAISDFIHMSESEKLEIDVKKAAQYIYNGKLSLVKSYSTDVLKTQGRNHNLNNGLSYKEAFIISYLEQIALYFIMRQHTYASSITKESSFYIMMPKKEQQTQYDWQKAHLLSILRELLSIDNRDYRYAIDIVKYLEAISAKYFIDYSTIEVFPEKTRNNVLDKLMKTLDESSRDKENHIINHKYYLKTEFKGISSGEARMIDIFAMLYNSINFSKHAKNSTCVLLLDEPDIGFHPEWSREFIEKLTNFLKSDMMNKYNYHIIISTHSPIMVSDVPTQCIHCISKNSEGKVEVKESRKYGLISGINDVLIDTFFADSLFGSFGEKYVKQIINQMKELEGVKQFDNQDTNNLNKRITECEEIKDKIEKLGEGYIKECLLRRLQKQRNRLKRELNWRTIND